MYARALGRRVSALANSVRTGSAPRVAPRIPLTSFVRGFLGLFAHFRPGKEENIPAQSYRTIDDFSEQTKRQINHPSHFFGAHSRMFVLTQ